MKFRIACKQYTQIHADQRHELKSIENKWQRRQKFNAIKNGVAFLRTTNFFFETMYHLYLYRDVHDDLLQILRW